MEPPPYLNNKETNTYKGIASLTKSKMKKNQHTKTRLKSKTKRVEKNNTGWEIVVDKEKNYSWKTILNKSESMQILFYGFIWKIHYSNPYVS